MRLTTKQIIALLQLPDCGRVTTFKLANYALASDIEIVTIDDLCDYIATCSLKKTISRLKEYSIDEVETAYSRAEDIINKSNIANISIVSYFDDHFPFRLKNLTSSKGSFSSPLVLYYRGDIKKANYPAIAIIGTREPTKEGLIAGEYFGKYFAENGFNIVSGLAIGCDTAGHKGAISGKGLTTAFLAHGLDTVYPAENKDLADSIIKSGGLLISEYPIGDKLAPNKLVDRDRLQAGLALATIVIQTGIKGGTMHAANSTLASQKPLYVIEYKSSEIMNHEKVQGNSFLISKGAKYLNTQNASEIVIRLSGKKDNQSGVLSLFDNI